MPYYLLKTNLHCNYFIKQTTTLKGAVEVHESSRMPGRDGELGRCASWDNGVYVHREMDPVREIERHGS